MKRNFDIYDCNLLVLNVQRIPVSVSVILHFDFSSPELSILLLNCGSGLPRMNIFDSDTS